MGGGGGSQTLVVRQLKPNLIFLCFPKNKKCFIRPCSITLHIIITSKVLQYIILAFGREKKNSFSGKDNSNNTKLTLKIGRK